jgi:methionine sulfoxide reductase heme-binding subunit
VSAPYQAVQWNAFKRRYDAAIAVGVAGYLGAFFAVSKLAFGGDRAFSDEVILIRATGSCAIVLLHVVLCIGPLTRMSTKFLPLLYNRRHLGVTTFAVAVVHGVVAIGFYHGFGVISPLRSLLTSNTSYSSLVAFPFETLGLFGLGVLFLLAATSHDFWLKNLTPTAWKWLHMLIYPTWAALVLHAALGAMQSRDGATYPTVLIAGAAVVASLHLVAARMQRRQDRPATPDGGNFIDVCGVGEIRPNRGRRVVLPDGSSAAVFRHGRCLSAVSNLCVHQGGPVSQGRIIDGCITCPWHGHQYRPRNGRAPEPFTDKLPTYRLHISAGRVLIDPSPLPPGTEVPPAMIEAEDA